MRASVYNAFPRQGVLDLIDFMKKFEAENKWLGKEMELDKPSQMKLGLSWLWLRVLELL